MFKPAKLIVAASAFVFAILPTAGNALDMQGQVLLQTTMAQHIERHMVNGVIPHVVLDDGIVVDLVPTEAHPMILSYGEGYVLCTDFRDPEGRFVNVDFYVAQGEEGFVIFQMEIDNRAPLHALMEQGKVKKIGG
ncbi:hypothetical protein [Maritalea sp. S77]|uniref:hypothetical protein n=1 Tax=Maritalea sp. S77 TaxID=3415125 RepID=UPI003C7B10DA